MAVVQFGMAGTGELKMRIKHIMPKNKQQFEASLENAFLAGCSWGYSVEHRMKIAEQEQIGADCYLGRISQEEASGKMMEIWEMGD